MKPCFNNRKLIALYVLGSLQRERATSVREHLAVCEGCHAYFNELSNISASLSTAEPQGITPSASFHRELVRRIKAETAEPVLTRMAESIRVLLLNWRMAVPAGVGLAVVLGILLTLPRHNDGPLAKGPHESPIPPLKIQADASPTFANYQMVANHSLDQLDELLTEQGSRNLPSAPIYTGSSW